MQTSKQWTEDEVATLRSLTQQHRRPNGFVNWKAIFADPAGQALLRNGERKEKDVSNRYTWSIRASELAAGAPRHAPGPNKYRGSQSGKAKARSKAGHSWLPEDVEDLNLLAKKYTDANGWVQWKEAEKDPLFKRLSAGRGAAALRQRYLKQFKNYKKKATLPPKALVVSPAPAPALSMPGFGVFDDPAVQLEQFVRAVVRAELAATFQAARNRNQIPGNIV